MRRRTRASKDSGPARPGRRATQRVAIVAGLVGLIVISLVGAAAAGVFSPAPKTVAAAPAERTAPHPATTARPDTTSCTSVAHIGDSTSVGMISAQWLPDPAQRLAAQYADVGVKHALIDASGGRSIVEEMPGQLNGNLVARQFRSEGFRGCWVFALGTNDTANVAAGSNVGLMARIREMMADAHGEPVMWVNTQTGLTSGPWSEANMRAWNSTLLAACKAYPNMRIFNWAAMVRPSWHLADGIHYTSAGYAIRAHAIARALARAFPAGGRSAGCVVS